MVENSCVLVLPKNTLLLERRDPGIRHCSNGHAPQHLLSEFIALFQPDESH